MEKYRVRFKEILSHEYIIEANSPKQAELKIRGYDWGIQDDEDNSMDIIEIESIYPEPEE